MLDTAIKLHQNNQLAEASQIYQDLLAQEPNNPDILYLYGLLLTQTGKIDDAVEYYYKALRTEFNTANQLEIYNRLIEIYNHKNDVDKVIYCHMRMVEIEPLNPRHYFNAGINYFKKSDGENAYKAYLNCIHLDPNFVEAHINLGSLYLRVRDLKNAEKHLLKALELNDNFLELYVSLGNLYIDTAETDKVIQICEQGLKKFPGNESIKFNLSRAHFLEGKLDKAWEYFRLRRLVNEKKELKTYLLDYKGPLKNKKVLVYSDSGFGDSIQFLRYVHLLKAQSAKVMLKVQPAIRDLVIGSNFSVEVLSNDQDLQQVDYDFHINLTSLAYLYKIDSYNDPYIFADSEKVEEYRKKYFDNNNFKIGLVWRSHANSLDPKNINDVMKLYPLAKIPGAKLYSFQQLRGQPWLNNLPDDFVIEHFADDFKDFSDTAAALQNLDLLITADTSVTHLAGAMGKKTWVLLPTIPNWRWFMNGETTPWYKNMEVIRQTRTGEWDEVIQKACIKLKNEFVGNKNLMPID